MPVESVSQLRDFSEERVTSRAAFFSPIYSLRRMCAHGEFENIVTEVGKIRRLQCITSAEFRSLFK